MLLAFCIMFAMPSFADKGSTTLSDGVVEMDSDLHYKTRMLVIRTPIHTIQYTVECSLDTPCPDGVCGNMRVMVRDTTRDKYIYMYGMKYFKRVGREIRLKFTLYDYGLNTRYTLGKIVGTKATVYVDYFPFDRAKTTIYNKVKYYTPLRGARQRAWSRKKAAYETKMMKHYLGDYYYRHGQVSPERKAKVERMRKAFWDKVAMYKAQVKAEDRKAWEEWKKNNPDNQ